MLLKEEFQANFIQKTNTYTQHQRSAQPTKDYSKAINIQKIPQIEQSLTNIVPQSGSSHQSDTEFYVNSFNNQHNDQSLRDMTIPNEDEGGGSGPFQMGVDDYCMPNNIGIQQKQEELDAILMTKESQSSKQSSGNKYRGMQLVQSKKNFGDNASISEDYSIPYNNSQTNQSSVAKPKSSCPFKNNSNYKCSTTSKEDKSQNEAQREILKQQYLKLKQELKDLTLKQGSSSAKKSTKPTPTALQSDDLQEPQFKLRSNTSTYFKENCVNTEATSSLKQSLNHSRNHKALIDDTNSLKIQSQSKTTTTGTSAQTAQTSSKSSFHAASMICKPLQNSQAAMLPKSILSSNRISFSIEQNKPKEKLLSNTYHKPNVITSSTTKHSRINSKVEPIVTQYKPKPKDQISKDLHQKYSNKKQPQSINNVLYQSINHQQSLSTMQYPKIKQQITKKKECVNKTGGRSSDQYHYHQNRGHQQNHLGAAISSRSQFRQTSSFINSNSSSQQSLQAQLFQAQNYKIEELNIKQTRPHCKSFLPQKRCQSQSSKNLIVSQKQSSSYRHYHHDHKECSNNHHHKTNSKHLALRKSYHDEQDYENQEDRYIYRGSMTPQEYKSRPESRCSSSQQSSGKKKCKRCLTKRMHSQHSGHKSSQGSLENSATDNNSNGSCMTPLAKHSHKNNTKYEQMSKAVKEMDLDLQKSLSPQRLNKELNKILETERMIKEYKEMITKMQRDMYSKKVTTADESATKEATATKQSLSIQKKKVFQEDIDPAKSIKYLVSKSYQANFRELRGNNNNIGGSRNSQGGSNMQKSRTEDRNESKSKTISLINDTLRDEHDATTIINQEEINNSTTLIPKMYQIEQIPQQQQQQAFTSVNQIPSSKQCIFNDKTIIPEEDWENTQFHQDDTLFNNQQQEQAILNFYQEFQEDESLRTPVSGFSQRTSFMATSSINNDKPQPLAQFGERKASCQGEEVKIVSIQLQGQRKPPRTRESDVHKINKHPSQNKKSHLIQSYQKQQIRSNTPSKRTSISISSTKNSLLQSLLFPKSTNNTTNLATSFQKPNSPQQSKLKALKTTTTPLSSKPMTSAISPLSQILYKKSSTGLSLTNNSTTLQKLVQDSQKRQAKLKDGIKNLILGGAQSQIKCQTIDLSQSLSLRSNITGALGASSGSSRLSTVLSSIKNNNSGQNRQRQSLGGTSQAQTPVAKLQIKLF